MPSKGWVFSISESWKILIGHEKVMEKSLNFIAQFLYEPCKCCDYFTVVLLLFFAGIVKCCCANLGRAFYFQGVYTFAGEFNKYVSTSTSTALLTSLRQS